MRAKLIWTCFALPAFVSGCSIHPDTQDFSRDFVPQIVEKIRCEAQDAIRQSGIPPGHPLMQTVLAYDFEFSMSEVNDATVGGSVTVPISLGSFIIGYSVGGKKERESIQKIKFADTFDDLMRVGCNPTLPRPNFIYPITGEIGIITTFRNFFTIAGWQPGDELEIFTDEIKFTTSLNAGVMPQIELAPNIGRNVSATANYHVSRVDLHRVTLGLDMPATLDQAAANKAAKVAALIYDRSFPYKVQIVDENGKPIALNGLPGGGNRPFADAPGQTGQGRRASRAIVVPQMTILDRKRRALQKLDESRTQILNRRLLERLR